MTPLEDQVTQMLGLTRTLNMLDAIDHVITIKRLLKITDQQRKEWADLCIKKQQRIDELETYIKELIKQTFNHANKRNTTADH